MARQTGWWLLAVACLLVAGTVLGVAAKVGRDTSEYLQTVSAHRDWEPTREGSTGEMVAGAKGGTGTAGIEGRQEFVQKTANPDSRR